MKQKRSLRLGIFGLMQIARNSPTIQLHRSPFLLDSQAHNGVGLQDQRGHRPSLRRDRCGLFDLKMNCRTTKEEKYGGFKTRLRTAEPCHSKPQETLRRSRPIDTLW